MHVQVKVGYREVLYTLLLYSKLKWSKLPSGHVFVYVCTHNYVQALLLWQMQSAFLPDLAYVRTSYPGYALWNQSWTGSNKVNYGNSMFRWHISMEQLFMQCNRTEHVISVLPNKQAREIPNCIGVFHVRGDALPSSDSSEHSPKFYTSPPPIACSSIFLIIQSPMQHT